MNPTSNIKLEGVETHALARVFKYITELTGAYWEAHLDGRLSRFIAPPPEVEESIIIMTEGIWRSVGNAIRSDSDVTVIRTSLDPNRLIVALDTVSRMLAFVPYAKESGVAVPDDRDSHMLLVYIVEEFVARAQESLAKSRETSPQGF